MTDDKDAQRAYENARNDTVHEYMAKPWSVSYLYDAETSQYRIGVPELGIETLAPNRTDGAIKAEDLLWTYFEGLYDTGTLSELPEPRVADESETS